MKKTLQFLFVIFVSLSMMTIYAQDYAGSESCKNCHSTQYNNWKQSGHPWKIQKIQNGNPPSYPNLTSQKTVGNQVNYTLTSGIPGSPAGTTWNDIGFVVGGYHSNARFLDKEGYLMYGPNHQYNLSTKKWVAYTSGTLTKASYTYSCYRCHTTGPSKTKTTEFNAFPGIEGSWVETGIGCEGCHGPAKTHTTMPISKPSKEGLNSCNACHARDRSDATTTFNWDKRVEWQARTVNNVSTGFVRHREQGDMLLASKHGKANFTCATCHEPHKGVYFDLGGLKSSAKCESCHQNKEIKGHELSKTKAECTDCHMPFAARNGDQLSPYVSDQSTHYWKVLTDPITMFDNLETINNSANPPVGYKFIKQDSNGISGITLDYACVQCHTTKDVAWASKYAKGIHAGITSVELAGGIPSAYTLAQNYPNPFNPSTKIKFAIPQATRVTLSVYAMTGEKVATLVDGQMQSGWHEVEFRPADLASGIYIYRIQAEQFGYSRKMVYMK